jgi:hypothetical protein
MTAQDRRALLRSEVWNVFTPRNEQFAFLVDLSEAECVKTFHSSNLADIFNVSPSRVRELRARARSTPRAPYRPMKLTPEQK